MNDKGKSKHLFHLAAFFLVFLTGCLNDRIIDKVQIIETLAYDMKGDKT